MCCSAKKIFSWTVEMILHFFPDNRTEIIAAKFACGNADISTSGFDFRRCRYKGIIDLRTLEDRKSTKLISSICLINSPSEFPTTSSTKRPRPERIFARLIKTLSAPPPCKLGINNETLILLSFRKG